jgi:hypothetical protein
LDDCLERLSPLLKGPTPFEIVVSDNGSTDDTAGVIRSHQKRNPVLRGFRQPENRGVWANFVNAIHQARGDVLVYVADDDSLILETLLRHVERMQAEPDLSAIYTDWIAWDDQREAELHRYFGLSEAVDFGPDNPMGLVNFVLQRMLMPEIGLYRRSALVGAHSFYRQALPFHTWMYALSRRGRVRFDPLAFYREHRVPKAGLHRTHWANMDMQMQFIGDEMRLSLEALLLMALQDAGQSHLPEDQMLNAKRAIDNILHSRAGLEIERACARGEWILAVELRRRQILWSGPGSPEEIRHDVTRMVMPAAAQAVALTHDSISGERGVSLRGFSSPWLINMLEQRYSHISILGPNEHDGALIVHRDEQSLAQDGSAMSRGNTLVFERLLTLYRVAAPKIDLRNF